MSQRTSKWFKTIEKVLCGLFFCKICCPYLDIRGLRWPVHCNSAEPAPSGDCCGYHSGEGGYD